MEFFGILDIPNFLLIAAIFWLAFYLYGRKNFSFFHGLGIKGPKPTAYFGNFREVMQFGFAHVFTKWHKEFGENYSFFWGSFPNVVIGDPDIIGEITVKRFSNFINRRFAFPLEDCSKKMVFFSKDDHWKYLRMVLSPSYSSKRMRQMVPLMQETFKNLEKNLQKAVDGNEETDLYFIFSGSAMDVIATTGFGIQVDSQENPNSPLVKNARRFFNDDIFNSLQLEITDNGFNRVTGLQECGVKSRKDLLQLMLDAQLEGHENLDKKAEQELKLENMTDWKTKRGLTDEEIIAQCINFLLAGFDSLASTLSYFAHTLAMNSDVQDKIWEEIEEQLGQELPDYDNVQKLTYLGMCMDETFRMYPIGFMLTREAKEDCTIKGLKIPKDSGIIVSTMSLHHNPKYWPEPEKFDPERFNKENKAKIKPYTYLPFGDGPRICPGMRLAILEFKMVVSHILKKFRFVPSKKSKKMEFAHANILKPKNGIWAKVERRN